MIMKRIVTVLSIMSASKIVQDNPILLLAAPNNWPDKSMWYVPKKGDFHDSYEYTRQYRAFRKEKEGDNDT